MTAVMDAPAEAADAAWKPVTKDDDSRYYPYPPTGRDLDSVTTIISGTDAKPWFKTHAAKVSSAWAVDHLPLLAITKGTKGRDEAVKLACAEADRLRDVKRAAGVYVHDVQQALILWAASPGRTGADIAYPLVPEHLESAWYDFGAGEGAPLVEVVEWMASGFVNFVSAFGGALEFLATEMTVYSARRGWAGTLDMIIELHGYAVSRGTGPRGADEIIASPGSVLRICVDTKTGKAPEGTWKEQLAAYRRADECLAGLGELRPMPATDCGAVLHLRPDYPDGWLLMLVSAGEDEAAWERFEKAASIYRDRQKVKDKPGPSVRPLRADGTMPGPRLADLAGEGYGRALVPLRKALGAETELADLAWFTAKEILAVKGVGPKLITAIREMLADHRLCLAGEELVPVLAAVRASTRAAALCRSTGYSTSSAGTRRSARSAWAPPWRCPARTTGARSGTRRSGSPRPASSTPGWRPSTSAARQSRGRGARAGGRYSPTAAPWTCGCPRASSRSTRTWSCGTASAACGTATASTNPSAAGRACAPGRRTRPTRHRCGAPVTSASASPRSALRRPASR